ncbi:MAG: serine protease [Paracoccaceae bacterium]|nr:MAG: serine protease [Paracoccaceae bacterium]
MRWMILLAALLAATPLRAGEDGALTRLLSLDEARPWAGVGRVNVAGNGFCTGTLIAPDRVLTAAHCLVFRRTGRPVPPGEISFLAGYRAGSFLAMRRVRRYAVHRDYRPGERAGEALLRADLAVLELESPVAGNGVQPFPMAPRPPAGAAVAVVSYARDRAHVPAVQEPCHVLALHQPVLILSCEVNFGASGAPVFLRMGQGPALAAMISAMSSWQGRRVALAVALDGVLGEVLAALPAMPAAFRGVRPGEEGPDAQPLSAPALRKVSRPPAAR